jgi:hypothetical protein
MEGFLLRRVPTSGWAHFKVSGIDKLLAFSN